MLKITKALKAETVIEYHQQEYSNGRREYYTEGETITGQWFGRLAKEDFGLEGAVQPDHFAALAEGRHPHVPSLQLITPIKRAPYPNKRGKMITPMEHRSAWDCVFSAPKSVSLVGLLADDRIRQAHRESVEVALGEFERYTQARMGGQRLSATTGRVAIAMFEHDTARPVDGYAAPQLHTHAVLFNMTRLPDQRFRSLQTLELFHSQQLATAVYRAELAQRVHALGYAVERGEHQEPIIKGISRDYVEAASPRHAQIEEYLLTRGLRGAESAEIAAHATRQAKLDLSKEDVLAQHRQMAAEFGDQPYRVAERARQHTRDIAPDPVHATAAMDYAKASRMDQEAVFDERHAITDALRHGLGKVTLQTVQSEFDRRCEAGEFLAREPRPGVPARAWTTPEMVALEQQTIARMQGDCGRPLVSEEIRQRHKPTWVQMKDDQLAAVEMILRSTQRTLALDGIAGTGKTYALAAIRRAVEDAGYVVHGVAPTGRAADILTKNDIPSETLQRYVVAPDHRDERPRFTIMDEASLADTLQMEAFLRLRREQDRVLIVGDVRQLQSVGPGKSFEQLQEHGLPTATLTNIRRQRDPRYKAIVRQLADGDVGPALDALHERGKVHEIPDRTERMAAVAAHVVAHPSKTRVFCPDNQSRRDLNEAIHTALQVSRAVDPTHQQTSVLVPRMDVTGSDRRYAFNYNEGDVVRYSKGSQTWQVAAGEYATVVARDESANTVTVQRQDGSQLTYDPNRLCGVMLYQPETRAFAVGDQVQFTAPNHDSGVKNRQIGTITALTPEAITVRLSAMRAHTFPLETHLHMDFGYALTVHSGQGDTTGRSIFYVDTTRAATSIVNARSTYVALSRGWGDVRIYTDDAERLEYALGRQYSNRAALERAPRRLQSAYEHTL